MAEQRTKCLIIGAGPVGSLAALYAADRGWDVQVYELRGDLRLPSTTPLNFTRSINLALSERGISAMRNCGDADLLQQVLDDTIPMYGRMIHDINTYGELIEYAQQYDIHGRFIRAVDRARLNKLLLDSVEKTPHVQLNFNHKLQRVDFKTRKATLCPTTPSPAGVGPPALEVNFDILLGCDGAYSRVRSQMMKFTEINFSQAYIDMHWCEFTIPPSTIKTPTSNDGFATSPNYLHIWPSEKNLFIAIPSVDRSFTCTLFASRETFTYLKRKPERILNFFESNFPGAAALIGENELQDQFERNPHLPLLSIKCAPHHHPAGVILGDAAHAMVPFYGQGMNAGLEDVKVLFSYFDKHPDTEEGRGRALGEYSQYRVPDAHAINDLALANYWEMHAGVKSPVYRVRKWVEEFLAERVPSSGFETQYARVSFRVERYSVVRRVVERQGRIMLWGLVGLVPVVVVGFWLGIRGWGRMGWGRMGWVR
ncbi:FAD/NAD(P)-binding domain-containing protein [Piedraia hortae CBS 480.64]|uniref:Kynurenine 3-monooxygenase n=1 Tax=Piedraia hortae CBS 480.64 TaxID=1314780 RepID=A0A6A7C7G4_9PEZI|nr:FAD/NAD(P)-binding domain-containing protein [Piedraia hortae CBS 480.64]